MPSAYSDQGPNELPIPVLEDCTLPANSLQKLKVQPSNLAMEFSIFSKYITLAMCRQKLHDEVLTKWISSDLTRLLFNCFRSVYAQKKRAKNLTKFAIESQNLIKVQVLRMPGLFLPFDSLFVHLCLIQFHLSRKEPTVMKFLLP